MHRCMALAGLFVAFMPLTRADGPAGAWKMTLPVRPAMTLLLAVSQTEGKWVVDVVDVSAKLRKEPKCKDVSVNGDTLKFTLVVDDVNVMTFEGVAVKDGKTIKGSLGLGTDLLTTIELQPTKLKSLSDSFEMAKEGLQQSDDTEIVFENAKTVLKQATAKKMPADDARAILDRVGKLAAGHGRRWDRHTTLKLADILASQEGMAEVALAQARKAERMLTDEDELPIRVATLEALVKSLTAAKKPDDAKPYTTQLQKLEAREWADYAKANPAFAVEEYKGRKGKSDRVVLVETFSGTGFEPSAAVDAARDGVLKAYKPAEVIVMTYHLPLNGDPDPLTVPDNMDRTKLYNEHISRGRHGLVAGKPSIGIKAETTVKDAQVIFETLRDRINEELELPAKVKLALKLDAGKDGTQATATWSELEKPADTVMLRFALVEDRIRHAAGNGTKYHQMIVRALPGGAKGFPMKAAAGEHFVTFQPHLLKEAIAKFLSEELGGKEGEPLPVDKMTALKNLKVIAYVQNDTTGEILTATLADVK